MHQVADVKAELQLGDFDSHGLLRQAAVKETGKHRGVNETILDSTALRSLTATTDQAGRLLRPARALLGWMDPEDAKRVLVSNRGDAHPSAAQVRAVETAHQAVSTRATFENAVTPEADLPASLLPHVDRLQKSPAGMPYFLEGWRIRLVNLTRLISFQPAVFVDSAVERVRGLKPDGLEGLANLCLPIPAGNETLAPTLDKVKNIWTVLSPNPNLRVVGQFAGPIQGLGGGAPVFGFFLALMPSFMQVAHFQGRYVLRDGYHRALGLLSAGIMEAPAFVRDFDAIEQLVPPGMLPQHSWLGPRPPLVPDYFDNSVAATVALPAVQKVVMVQAIEATVSA